MIIIDKKQEWQDLEKRMARIIDKLGMRIDKGIMEAVTALNANDVRTSASCEGHSDRALPYPWVDISSEEGDRLSEKIFALIREGRREDDETQRLMEEVKELHRQEEMKLMPLLEAFYHSRPISYDSHLVLFRFAKGQVRLQSHGAEYQAYRDPSERAEKLKEYQREMQSFAAFLKEKFFEQQP